MLRGTGRCVLRGGYAFRVAPARRCARALRVQISPLTEGCAGMLVGVRIYIPHLPEDEQVCAVVQEHCGIVLGHHRECVRALRVPAGAHAALR